MYRSPRVRFAMSALLLVVAGLLLSLLPGCSAPIVVQATYTPTKTPRPATATPTAPPPTPTVRPSPTPTATPTPTRLPYDYPANVNPLTGLEVTDPTCLARRPLMVAVNNDLAARPQYGLAEADLVYEYIMEGRGVTRFTAVFLSQESQRIGPVRSARLVNFYLTPQYGAALVASGAGQEVRWWLKNKMPAPYLDVDLDDPQNNVYVFTQGYDYRTRVQTSTERLRQWLADWQVEAAPAVRGFAFSADTPAGEPATSVTVDFPGGVTWDYDTLSGAYQRSAAGTLHLDAATGLPLRATNVIIQTVAHELTEYVDVNGAINIRIIPIGEGPATILRDGVAVAGTWRAGDTSMPEFFDADGNLILLKPGNTWFELIDGASNEVSMLGE